MQTYALRTKINLLFLLPYIYIYITRSNFYLINTEISIQCAFWLYSLLEEGGKTFTFEGPRTNCPLKSALRIQNPHFYWKVINLFLRLTLGSFERDHMQENYEFKSYSMQYIISGILQSCHLF